MLGCRYDHARPILFSKSYITHAHSPPCRCSYRDEAHQSRSLRSYQVERAFYAHIAPLLRDRGIALPGVLAAVWGGDNMQGITVLEDLGSTPGATGEPPAAATRMHGHVHLLTAGHPRRACDQATLAARMRAIGGNVLWFMLVLCHNLARAFVFSPPA